MSRSSESEVKMERLKIYTLGGLKVLQGDKLLTEFRTHKVEALLVYLACNRRDHPREVLADLLWDERSQQQAQSNLRVALANLRKHLGDYVTIDRDTAALNPQATIWIDTTDMVKGLRNWQAGKGLKSEQEAEQVKQAIELYQGDFLEGFTVRECRGFEDWSVRERERLHGLAVDSLHDLVAFELENAAYQAGLAHATRLLEIDPLMEAAHCQRMALLARSGRRNEALAQYETLKRILWEELGIIPTEATEALLQKIRTGEMEQVKSVAQVIRGPEIGETILPNPYKGLRAFTEADASDFFGREALTDRLLARLGEAGEASRFLAVVGPSGSGKSSVVKAGLIPALRRGALPGSENWHILEILPGAHPLEELEIGLLRIAGEGRLNLSEQLQRDERGLIRAVRLALPGESSQLLLVIDQFEELFSLVQDRATLKHFLNSLSTAVIDPHSPLRVVITLRADFFDRPLSYPGLSSLVQQRTELVLPLTPQEVEQAIRAPAERVGVNFEPGLVTKIIAEVVDQPGALPLLQYSLTELFERREGQLLTNQAYQAIGGVVGALSHRAEELYNSLDQAGQEAARQLFLRLVTLGEGAEETRRRVLRSELGAISIETEDNGRLTEAEDQNNGSSSIHRYSSIVMDTVIKAFGQARLLSFDWDPLTREPTVEVAHEALLREWVRLRAWLDESREDLRQQERSRLMAAEWDQAGRESSFLLRGSRLGQFEGWAASTSLSLTPIEKAYLQASLAERAERQQRELKAAQKLAEAERQRAEEQAQLAGQLRRRALFLAGALLVAAILAAIALGFGLRAEAERGRAELQAQQIISRDLVSAAIDNLKVDPERSILLALHAVSAADTLEAEDALHRAIQASRLRLTLSGQSGSVIEVAFNPDGTRLATAAADGTVKVWDTATGQELFTPSGKTSFVDGVAFSPDGQRLAEAYFDGSVEVRDIPLTLSTGTASGPALLTLPGQTDQIHSILDLAFSPDGRRLVTAGKVVTVWDAVTGRQLLSLSENIGWVTAVAFSPDGKRLATARNDGTISVWDAATGQELLALTSIGAQAVAFSQDGKRLVTGHSDGSARVWDASSGRELLSLTGHTSLLFAVAFSPNGTRLATASGDNKAKIWDTFSGKELFTLSSHAGKIYSLAFSPDGDSLATASADGTARLWDISSAGSREVLTPAGHSTVLSAAFLPDGALLTAADEDGTTKILAISPAFNALGATNRELLSLSSRTGNTFWAQFSPDGKRLATFGGNKTVRIWDVSTGRELFTLTGNSDVYLLNFSPNGGRLATVQAVWELFTRQVSNLTGEYATGATLSPDGTRLATANPNGKAYIWDVTSGQKLLTFSGHNTGVNNVVFSPDGTRLATADNDGIIKVWDANSAKEISSLRGQTVGIYGFFALAFSPEGRRLATAGTDGTVTIWDAISGGKLLDLRGHTGQVWWVAFSPDGRRLASIGEDGTLRVYAVEIGELVALAKSRLTRSLTTQECQQYLHVEQCPPLP